jgi:hypothetical protein
LDADGNFNAETQIGGGRKNPWENERFPRLALHGVSVAGFIGAGLFSSPIIANGMARYLRLSGVSMLRNFT